MTRTPASAFERHRELSNGFALIAPLGGGAVMALHALQQHDDRGSFVDHQAELAASGFITQETSNPPRRQRGWPISAFAWS